MLGKPVFTNKIVAKNLGIKEEKVKSVTDFFFKELHKEIKECNHPFIYIKGLGTFALMLSKLKRTLKYYVPKVRGSNGVPPMKKGKEAMTAEIFEWFRILRMLKNQYKHNKNVGIAAKTGNDSKG